MFREIERERKKIEMESLQKYGDSARMINRKLRLGNLDRCMSRGGQRRPGGDTEENE